MKLLSCRTVFSSLHSIENKINQIMLMGLVCSLCEEVGYRLQASQANKQSHHYLHSQH